MWRGISSSSSTVFLFRLSLLLFPEEAALALTMRRLLAASSSGVMASALSTKTPELLISLLLSLREKLEDKSTGTKESSPAVVLELALLFRKGDEDFKNSLLLLFLFFFLLGLFPILSFSNEICNVEVKQLDHSRSRVTTTDLFSCGIGEALG